jgi:hypothetical protein
VSARVISLDRFRVERLADEIAGQLRANGNSVCRLTANVANVAEWRMAARAAGRRMGIQIRTGISRQRDRVWAVEGP